MISVFFGLWNYWCVFSYRNVFFFILLSWLFQRGINVIVWRYRLWGGYFLDRWWYFGIIFWLYNKYFGFSVNLKIKINNWWFSLLSSLINVWFWSCNVIFRLLNLRWLRLLGKNGWLISWDGLWILCIERCGCSSDCRFVGVSSRSLKFIFLWFKFSLLSLNLWLINNRLSLFLFSCSCNGFSCYCCIPAWIRLDIRLFLICFLCFFNSWNWLPYYNFWFFNRLVRLSSLKSTQTWYRTIFYSLFYLLFLLFHCLFNYFSFVLGYRNIHVIQSFEQRTWSQIW